MSDSTVDRDPFERLAEEFAERLRHGEHPSLTEYVARCPERADDIRELFPALALVEHYKPAPDNSEHSSLVPVPTTRGDLPDRLGDYRILRYLGEGGMGVVYEAVRESLHSHVALKVMHTQYRNREKYLRRFRAEARAAARLHHTNIVSVFDYGVEDGVCFYAMQYIAGQSLDKILIDLRQLRKEKKGFAAAEMATLASGSDDRLKLGERNTSLETGRASMDPLGQTVACMLLTGRYAIAVPSEGSDDGDTPPLPTGSAALRGAFEDADQMVLCAGKLAVQICTPVGGELKHTGPTSRALGFDADGAQTEIPPARVPPPESGDVQDGAQPSPDGSTSTLVGKSDARYYREVARLGAQVADALAYAHRRGVLHRDIKPPNLILDPLGNIWITDFGLAKFEEGDDLSQSHDIAGTLRYMAPERLRGVSTAQCDLYALGTTLYEMLTLRPPFDGQDQLQLIHRIENQPPVPPRQLERHIPSDLETIVLKALAKDPNDRFETAEEMAGELRLFVENRPIRSRPIPFYQQFWRWCRRNPGLAGANIAAAVLTTILAVISTLAALTLARAEYKTRLQLFEALHDRARAGRSSHRAGQRFNSLDALKQAITLGRELKLPPERFDSLRDEAIACMALPDLQPTGRVITQPQSVISFAFDPTMTRYALGFRDGTIQVRRVAADDEVASFHARGDGGFGVFAFSPDGRYLATAKAPRQALSVWDIDRRATVVNDRGPVHDRARFSPDSRRIAVVHANGDLLVYDLATGQPSRRGRVPKPGVLAFRFDGAQIAVISDEKGPTCRILETETGRLVLSIPLKATGTGVQWSPDGTILTTPCADRMIYLWDAATGTLNVTLRGHTNSGLGSAFHPAGTLLASNGWESRLWLWDPVLGHPWLNLPGASNPLFSRDGRIVVSFEHQLTTYLVEPALEYGSFAHAGREPNDYGEVTIRSDGRVLALGTNRGVAIWDLARGRELEFLPIGYAMMLRFEASGDLLTSGPRGVWRWPVRLDLDLRKFRIGPPRQLPLPPGIEQIAEDQSGRIVALARHDFAHVNTPERTFQIGPLDHVKSVAVSPDGEYLATGCHGTAGAQVWRLRDSALLAHREFEGLVGVKFSSDGKWLMTENPPCRLWEVGTWREAQRLNGRGRCFSPDGRQVVVVDPSKVLLLVEAETGRTLARLMSPDLGDAWAVTFSPDGSRLVVSTRDGPAVHVWDLRAIRRRLTSLGLDWDAPAYPEQDPASSAAPPLPPLQIDYGPLAGRINRSTE